MAESVGIVHKEKNIKATAGKKNSGVTHLRNSLVYITNHEKTVGQWDMNPIDQLTRECKYVENDLKTFDGAFVGGHNVSSHDAKTAVAEMMEIKNFYDKVDERIAKHMIISLPEDESNISNASKLMQLADDVIKEVFPNYQAIYAVHTNTDNLHCHIIINTVALDGRKLHEDNRFVREILHPCINKYASVYGFTQNQKWKTAQYDRLSFPQLKMALRSQIDKAIEQADNFDDFTKSLEQNDIQVRVGKYISLKFPGKNKAIRSHNLGSNYTRDAIVERIATRKEKFIHLQSGNHAMQGEKKDIYTPTIFKMPKYKDMPAAQKKETVRLLKMGLNPWRENQRMNWQLNRIADELNLNDRIRSYVEFYSSDGTVESAMEGMIEAKKQASREKNLIVAAKRKYKPILDIYEEMKQIEKKSYLYEHKGYKEYRSEFEQYRNLTRRLKNGYNKEVFEVASFLEECNERMIYAQAQVSEISEEYREMKKYASKRGIALSNKENNLFDLLDYYSDKENKNMGIASQDAYYISSPHSDVVIRVVKYPTMDKYGHLTESYDLTVTDRQGKVIKQILSSGGEVDFKKEIDKLQKEYGLVDCKRFSNMERASEFCSNRLNVSGKAFEDVPVTDRINGGRPLTFAQAINHVSDERPEIVVLSKNNPRFMALSAREKEGLKIIIFNDKGRAEEVFSIPHIKKKNSDGYGTLVKIMDKYGFNNEVREFNTFADAEKYKVDTAREAARGRSL